MTIQALGQLLTASRDDRTLRYRLLPFGEAGRTNKGSIIASAGAVEIPGEALPVNLEHDYTRPVGTMVTEETAEGLDALVNIANTRTGDDVLEEAAAGLRAGISVEIDSPVVRAGKLIAGKLAGAGLVVRPAFPSALLTAADCGDLPQGEPPVEPETAVTSVTERPAAPAPALPESLLASMTKFFAEDKPKEEEQPKLVAANGSALDQLCATLFGLDGITNPQLKAAALDTITQADMYDPTSVPQYLDELAQARQYREIFTPLFKPATLTAMEIEGWHIEKKPTVGPWDPAFSGTRPNETMNDIPTSEVTFKKETWTAKRFAGGNRFDRVHIDFPNPRAMAAFVREQDLSIHEQLDAFSKQQLLSMAVAKEATGSDATDAWSKLVYGCAWALKFGVPDFAVVGNDVWRQLKVTAEIDRRAWITSQLGIESGSLDGFDIVPADIDDTAMNGRIFVGSTAACELYTPPGSVVRVDAQELQKGAVDKAVFGYYAFVPHYEAATKNGIVEVTAAA